MNLVSLLLSHLFRFAKDVRGQDIVEYALMGGVLAAAAGFFLPGVATSIHTIFSHIASVLANAAGQGTSPLDTWWSKAS